MEPRLSIVTLGVQDMQRSYSFYHDGLELPTSAKPTDAIIFFKTSGCCLALYPADKLQEDIGEGMSKVRPGFGGITLAHNVRSKSEVDGLLERVAASGGEILKPAQDAFWGGYHGYFADPDGYVWEVAYGDCWTFNPDGSLVIP